MIRDPGREVALFPLHTVLFPGGALPLRVFEQRYVEMTKACLREDRPFGVCLIREGAEVGAAAVPEPVGCLAAIEHWEMPAPGLFHLLARGIERFRIRDSRIAPNQLLTASIEPLPPEPAGGEVDGLCRQVLEALLARLGTEGLAQPPRLGDPVWVGYRLSEALPLPLGIKQRLLEMQDPQLRLACLRRLLSGENPFA